MHTPWTVPLPSPHQRTRSFPALHQPHPTRAAVYCLPANQTMMNQSTNPSPSLCMHACVRACIPAKQGQGTTATRFAPPACRAPSSPSSTTRRPSTRPRVSLLLPPPSLSSPPPPPSSAAVCCPSVVLVLVFRRERPLESLWLGPTPVQGPSNCEAAALRPAWPLRPRIPDSIRLNSIDSVNAFQNARAVVFYERAGVKTNEVKYRGPVISCVQSNRNLY